MGTTNTSKIAATTAAGSSARRCCGQRRRARSNSGHTPMASTTAQTSAGRKSCSVHSPASSSSSAPTLPARICAGVMERPSRRVKVPGFSLTALRATRMPPPPRPRRGQAAFIPGSRRLPRRGAPRIDAAMREIDQSTEPAGRRGIPRPTPLPLGRPPQIGPLLHRSAPFSCLPQPLQVAAKTTCPPRSGGGAVVTALGSRCSANNALGPRSSMWLKPSAASRACSAWGSKQLRKGSPGGGHARSSGLMCRAQLGRERSRRLAIVEHHLASARKRRDPAQRGLHRRRRQIGDHAQPHEEAARLRIEARPRQRVAKRLPLEVHGRETHARRCGDPRLHQSCALPRLGGGVVRLEHAQAIAQGVAVGEGVQPRAQHHRLAHAPRLDALRQPPLGQLGARGDE